MKRRIFVSCGQRTADERKLGQRLRKIVEAKPGMSAFFAQDVHSAGDLNAEIFRELQRCDGFFSVMQKRGQVVFPGVHRAKAKHRASVWIEQEIAILCYRMFVQRRDLPIRVYKEEGIDLEGVMGFTIVNPEPFTSTAEVLKGMKQWLDGAAFKEEPGVARRADLFRQRVASFTNDHWLFLEILVAHAPMRDEVVQPQVIHRDFETTLGAGAGVDPQSAAQRGSNVNRELFEQQIIESVADRNSGFRGVKIANEWWDLILEELRDRGLTT